MGEVLAALLDLVLPQRCPGCGAQGQRWCRACAGVLVAAADRPLGRVAPTPAPPGFPAAAAGAPYADVVRGAVLGFKEHGQRGLAAPLGRVLAGAVRVLVPRGPVILVPVPSDRAAVRRRGFDHTDLLARAAARELGRQGRETQVVRALVVRTRRADQAGLGAGARAANLAGAFALRRSVPVLGRAPLVLVDDIVTTGATASEAARALAAADVRPAGLASVAATRRRTDASLRGRSAR